MRSTQRSKPPVRRPRVETQSTPPDDCCGESDGGSEVDCELVVSGGDAAPILETTEHSLDDVAAAVELRVEGAGVLSRRIIRNDRECAALDEVLAKTARVIGAVGGERPCGGGLGEENERSADISELSGCHLEGDETALRVADGVDFGRAPPAGAADPLFILPPFPPAAERWALAVVESSA